MGKRFFLIALGIFALLAGLIAADPLILLMFVPENPDSLDHPLVGFSSETQQIGFPPGASEPREIRYEMQDGNSPEMLSYSFSVRGNEQSVIRYFEDACKRNGFQRPASPWDFPGGDALCEVEFRKGSQASFSVTPNCKDNQCDVFVRWVR